MMTLTYALTDEQAAILALDMVDPQTWLSGLVEAKVSMVVRDYTAAALEKSAAEGLATTGLSAAAIVAAAGLPTAQERNEAALTALGAPPLTA